MFTSKVEGVAVSRHIGGEVRSLPVRVQLVLVPCIRAIRALRPH